MIFNLPKLLETLSNLSENEMNDILDLREEPDYEKFWMDLSNRLEGGHEFHPNQNENFILPPSRQMR